MERDHDLADLEKPNINRPSLAFNRRRLLAQSVELLVRLILTNSTPFALSG
jgi:hypothetical protein